MSSRCGSPAELRERSDGDEPLLPAATLPSRSHSVSADPMPLVPAGASLFQTIVSIFNIIMGIGVLSMPYAMAMSGAAGVLSVALCCVLFCTSGKCIAWSMDRLPPGVPHSYPQLGYEAMGTLGQRLVTAFAILDLSSGSCLLMIVLWKSLEILLQGSMAAHRVAQVSLLAGVLIEMPLCTFASFRFLSVFSFAGCTSTVAVMLLVVALPALDPHRQCMAEPPEHAWLLPGLVPATGIVALSVAGHSTFPSVRAGMAEPRRFTSALNWTYVATAGILGCMTSIGYWYWGAGAHTLVTRDFDLHSPYTHLTIGGNFGIHTAVDALVVLNVVTTLPLLVLSLQDIVHSFFTAEERSGHPHGPAPAWPAAAPLSRLVLLCAIMGVAYFGRNVLGPVESFVGAICAVQCSLLLPTVFYVALSVKQKRMRTEHWIGLGGMLIFGVALDALILVQAVRGLEQEGAVCALVEDHGAAAL